MLKKKKKSREKGKKLSTKGLQLNEQKQKGQNTIQQDFKEPGKININLESFTQWNY